VMLWQYPAVSRTVFIASLAFPVYYVVLSLALQLRRPRNRGELATEDTKVTKIRNP
jgi:hypothetical protein